jgi:membrane protein YdbS with pleckstrin-like domain
MGRPASGQQGDPFAAADESWTAVSPRLTTVRRLIASVISVPVVLLAVVLAAQFSPPLITAAVAGAGVLGWGVAWTVAGRTARSWRYAERADDLLISHGVLIKRLVIVPYGRMQLVDVSAGPVDRAFRLVRVQLHTAAATTDAHLPGVPPPEATRLRDQLTALGAARAAGL